VSKRSPSVAIIEAHSSADKSEIDRGRVTRVVIMGGAALLILFAWLHLIMALGIAATSREIQELGKELERIERENMGIARDIATAEMIQNLSGRAEKLGYGPQTPLYLPLSEPVSEQITGTTDVEALGSAQSQLMPATDLDPLSRFLIEARFDARPVPLVP